MSRLRAPAPASELKIEKLTNILSGPNYVPVLPAVLETLLGMIHV